jgi:hypothetical protein
MSLDEKLLVDPLDQPDHPRFLTIPRDFYWILEQPAPLAGMSDPRWAAVDWHELWDLGFRSVVCLSESQPAYDPLPLSFAWWGHLEDLFGSWPPQDPTSELLKIKQATAAVVEELAAKRGVVVHCLGGIGRTGTVCSLPHSSGSASIQPQHRPHQGGQPRPRLRLARSRLAPRGD